MDLQTGARIANAEDVDLVAQPKNKIKFPIVDFQLRVSLSLPPTPPSIKRTEHRFNWVREK